ncbi:zinc transport system substrate-binding protein [Rhodobium orientis]|uniref:High-affinity zinc uptake system protein ZnuA n=1 Tax=Rhodobium orientis TaxID=34017 RepID=A0A327JKD3_9HYPH|nr:zinc ABC transporter substrate-binding protein [Rhodobium orientis]MBB4303804.1 zinc transport system substrate-binding protein [Rhodobium orientis]MBK5947922.1 hypothetical protein [Rhodobium orientis]RAI26086.1 hypothetical protein CH339_15605 [Rhodobium orientis]
MHRLFSTGRPLAAFLLTLFSGFGIAEAGEKVVVSTPPLHSLVATLLEGVDSPGLLFASRKDLAAPVPSADAMAAIDGAEMVVWAGREYETALAGLRTLDPSVSLKSLTLGATTPLMSISLPDNADRPSGRHDMRFWLDPRLARTAVGRIASNLVRVYPDDANRILDNEILLKERLKELEASMRSALGSPEGVPLHVPASDVLYLTWRFNLAAPNCPAAAKKVEAFGEAAGPGLYFRMMAAVLADLKACQPSHEPAS